MCTYKIRFLNIEIIPNIETPQQNIIKKEEDVKGNLSCELQIFESI